MADEANAIPSEAPDAPWIDDDKGPIGDFHQHYTIFLGEDDFDDVQRPAHYNQGEFEVIDIIQDKLTPEQFKGYCLGNQLKYVLRHEYKGHPKQDLEKAMWYFKRMMEALYGGT